MSHIYFNLKAKPIAKIDLIASPIKNGTTPIARALENEVFKIIINPETPAIYIVHEPSRMASTGLAAKAPTI